MRIPILAVLLALMLAAQSAPSQADASAASLEKAAIRALAFQQGDATSLAKSRPDFTAEGWNKFMQTLQGFLDDNKAPTFTSAFAPAGKAVVVPTSDGTIFLKIPGTWTQSSGASRTTYRLRLEVRGNGSPAKIERLEEITCPQGQAANYCMGN
ncbi:MAG TPA: hypothetical protein VFO39_22090 [Candidatus Sulfotelmatobacter sp.]|nr:hypothetical protein [Candidatus Sulfotelmatobacter sp.]